METKGHNYNVNNRILIVDDRAENIYAVVELLKSQCYETDQAESGQEALKKILKNDYALILLDVQMPGMDGFETARLIKGNKKNKDIPIIFLTAISKNNSFVIKGLLTGAVDYLSKPIDDDLLILKVQTFLELYNQQQELKFIQNELNILNNTLQEKVESRTKEIKEKNDYLAIEVEKRIKYEDALGNIFHGISTKTGQEYFDNLVIHLNRALATEYAIIGRYSQKNQCVDIISYCEHDKLVMNISKNIYDIPLESINSNEVFLNNSFLKNLFPSNEDTKSEQVLSYIGVTLFDSKRKPIGIIAVRYYKVTEDNLLNTKILRLFASRSASELERMFSNEEAEKQKAHFEQLFFNSPNGIVILDKNGVIVKTNNSFENIFGYKSNNIVGKYIEDIISPVDMTDMNHIIYEKVKKGEVFQLETCKKKADGTLIDIELISYPVFINNELVGAYAIYSDITENKIMIEVLEKEKERAEEMNRIKSNFLANMSHEIRTPMIGILGYAEILDEIANTEELKEISTTIMSSGKRMMDTLNLLIDLSRIEANKEEILLEEIDIKNDVADVIKLFQPAASKKNLDLKFTVNDDSVYAIADKRMLTQIISNLINNAIKFTNEGSVLVEFSSQKRGKENWAVINIKDTGIGIAEEYLDTIFFEFRQASEGYNRKYEGTGLGLTISKKYVELMKGNISVESKEEMGSTFTVTLPGVPKNQTDKNDSIMPRQKDSFNIFTKMNMSSEILPLVLLVEDDPINQNVVKVFLRKICEVEIASTADEGLKMARKKQYDIVLLDINLGKGINGVDILKYLKTIPEYKNTPMIAVTAYAMVGDKHNFLSEGFTAYLSKPYSKHALIDILYSIIEKNDIISSETNVENDKWR